MALTTKNVHMAVLKAGQGVGTSPFMKNMAIEEVLPILVAIVEDMGWFRRVFVGIRTLIKVLRMYLKELDGG